MMGWRKPCRPEYSNGAVGRTVHALQIELFDPRFIRRDGRAFDAHSNVENGIGRIHGYLVFRLVAAFHAEVVIFEVNIKIGVISLSLIICQMIRVISSPSSSTMGFPTLIFVTMSALYA